MVKRKMDALEQLVAAAEKAARPTPKARAKRPLTEETKAKLRAYAAAKAAAKRQARLDYTPIAKMAWDAFPMSKRSRTYDMKRAGPYARSAATYVPNRNDWPGVDDLGVGGAPLIYTTKSKRAAGVGPYGGAARARKPLTQAQLDALARGREIRRQNLGR